MYYSWRYMKGGDSDLDLCSLYEGVKHNRAHTTSHSAGRSKILYRVCID